MKAYEIRNMSDSDIRGRLEEIEEELFNLRFQFTIGQARDTNQMAALNKDIARLKTVLKERELVES